VLVGKLDPISVADANAFAHGKGDTQFFNLAFGINPVALMAVPYGPLCAGVVLLPTKDPKSAIIQFLVADSEGKANTTGFDTVGHNGTAFGGEGRVRTDFFGLTGHQLVGGAYSNKRFSSIDQRLGQIIIAGGLQKKTGSWAVYYNFDQYLYERKKGSGEGIGIFGRFGISDGSPNLLFHFYSIGIGGKGLMCNRPLDSFGIGYYYQNVSNPTVKTLRQSRSFLRDEQGFEAFYSVAVTPWMMFTPDIQVVNPAQKHSVSGGIGNPFISPKSVDTAVVPGFRLQLIF
jgi:porin